MIVVFLNAETFMRFAKSKFFIALFGEFVNVPTV